MKSNEKKKGGSIIEKMFSGKTFYVTLAGITLAVGLITYFGIKASYNDTKIPSADPPSSQVDDPVIPSNPSNPSNPNKPIQGDEGTDKPVNPADKPTVPTVTYGLPANGVVTKEFSGEVLVFSSTMGDYRVHTGIDITAEEGSEVMAAADGEITAVYSDDLKGVCVEISHADGHKSIYCNLKTVLADGTVEGAAVKAGDVIGYVGTTALFEVGDPAHLHFEMMKDGEYVSPTGILPEFTNLK